MVARSCEAVSKTHCGVTPRRRIARLPDHAFLAEYREYCFLPGREIGYSENGEIVRAVALGVEDTGGLRVRLPDGTERVLTSGEVSVRLS